MCGVQLKEKGRQERKMVIDLMVMLSIDETIDQWSKANGVY